MALLDVEFDRHVQSMVAQTFQRWTNWVAETRTRASKKAALRDLLFAPEHRLRDLGIRRDELTEALARRR